LQLVGTVSPVLPPRVGNAGHGYPTSRRRTPPWVDEIGAGGKAKASGLGVGDLLSTRDNKSVAEIDKRHHLFGADRTFGRGR
jgi:hypothetical protein